jgi:hypothetical protein
MEAEREEWMQWSLEDFDEITSIWDRAAYVRTGSTNSIIYQRPVGLWGRRSQL